MIHSHCRRVNFSIGESNFSPMRIAKVSTSTWTTSDVGAGFLFSFRGAALSIPYLRAQHTDLSEFARSLPFLLQNVGGFVLGCIEAGFCEKICVVQYFSSSAIFVHLCTASNSIVSQKNEDGRGTSRPTFGIQRALTFATDPPFKANEKLGVHQN